MAKIRVSDLATKMGIPLQDLLFKMKSIGVRIEGEDESIDTEVIQALLTGKRMQQPREVILRDETAAATAPAPGRRPPPRRVPPNPLRGPRRRTMIQRVEPRIKTIPAREKPAEGTEEAAAAATAATTEATAPAATPVAPVAGEQAAQAPAPAAIPAVETEVAPPREPSPAETRRLRRQGRQDGAAEEVTEDRQGTPVTISEGMTVREFAEKLGVRAKDLIQKLISHGVMASINHVLDADTAEKLAEELGFETMQVTFEEEVQLQDELRQPERGANAQPRAPVITVMGHIDHGKTSLLDAIRSASVTASEAGGITQHIGAYKVDAGDHGLVFLDTPGHEAFTKLRARGAQVTDIVILMVAADDGVMPQTVEAINHAKAANVPIVVAINKIDKANANQDRVKKDLADQEIMVEEWGGDVVAVPMSALKGEGVDEMVEILNITADLLDLKADPDIAAQGVVLEARKDPGKGNLATVLVQRGTLRIGDVFVSGSTSGRVRSIFDDLGKRLQEAGPSTPVEVTGFGELPGAGDMMQVVESEAKARSIAELRRDEARRQEMAPTHGSLSLDQLFDRIQTGDVEELPIILKADVQGSLEVLRDTLTDLSTSKVKVRIIHGAVGAVTTNDVTFAVASNAIVIGFNVRPEKAASDLASREGVDIRTHTIIYELIDELKQAMTGLLKPTYREVDRGRAEVRDTFKVPRIGTIAGCHVIEGVIPRGAPARLLRDNVVVYEGRVASLRRFKDDASEVRSGFDCGIGLERYQDVKPGDFIEVYEREEVAATL
jgi:translation initiation factor IF-2